MAPPMFNMAAFGGQTPGQVAPGQMTPEMMAGAQAMMMPQFSPFGQGMMGQPGQGMPAMANPVAMMGMQQMMPGMAAQVPPQPQQKAPEAPPQETGGKKGNKQKRGKQ